MKDDPREVDWAPNRIRELQRKMGVIEAFLGKPSESEMFEEGGTVIEAFEQVNRRQNSLSQRLLDQGKRHTETKKNLEDRIARLDRAFGERTAAFERRVVRGDVVSQELTAVGRRVSKLENRFEKGYPDGEEVQPWEIWAEIQLEKLAAGMYEGQQSIASIRDDITDLRERRTVSGFGLEDLTEKVNHIEEGYVTEAGFNDLIGRVRRLESQTQFETTEDDARIKALEAKFEGHLQWAAQHDHPDDMAQRIDGLEKTFNRFREVIETALHNYGIPIPPPEDKIPQFGAPWSGYDDNLRPLEFSPPVGGRSEPSRVDIDEVTVNYYTEPKVRELTRKAHLEGQGAGGDAAIHGAERRVRAMMENHFSEATICEVLKAVRGEGL